MTRYLLIIGMVIFLGCHKDRPRIPQAAELAFPLKDSECTSGKDLSTTTSQVEFRWLAAQNAASYELRVTNQNTAVAQTVSTPGLSSTLPLVKGTPYSWLVISRNSESEETASSETWQFYNAGSLTSYAPFPASIITPKSGATKAHDSNNQVRLEWSGADADNDITGYEVYYDTETPPLTLLASPLKETTNLMVTVVPGTIYYWKIITIDSKGNASDSGIFSFKAT